MSRAKNSIVAMWATLALASLLGVGEVAAQQTSPAKAVDSSKEKLFGPFDRGNAKAAQKHVKMAENLTMAELMDGAKNLKPDFILAYGLALELGRTPASFSMSKREKEEILSIFSEVLDIYIKAKDNIKLKGNEQILLDQPDFWIVISRSMSFQQLQPDIVVTEGGGPQLGLPTGGQANNISSSTTISVNGRRFKLRGDPMFNSRMVSAGQSCAISARVAARMKKVMTIASVSHLTAEKMAEHHKFAALYYKQAVSLGVDACVSSGSFKRTYGVAEQNLGALNRLDSDPALSEKVEAQTKLPEEKAND